MGNFSSCWLQCCAEMRGSRFDSRSLLSLPSGLIRRRRSSSQRHFTRRQRVLETLEGRQLLAATTLDWQVADMIATDHQAVTVVQAGSTIELTGQRADVIELPHSKSLELAQGTVVVEFTADDVSGRRTLFSKDARDFGDGGHVSAFVRDGRLEVRLQSETESFTLFSEPGSIRAGQEYHFAMTFGAGGFRIFLDGDLVNSKPEFTGGIENNAESLVIGANTWARDAGNPNWRADFFAGQIREFTIYNRALNRAEAALLGGAGEQDPGAQAVGLEQLVRIILNDPGLNRSVDPEQIQLGAQYAFALNWLIEGAIEATGVANDREIQVADIYDINAYLRRNENSIALWTGLHGDDQGDAETGFHLVQNDGATTQLFGDSNAVNTVADGIYHLGFEIEGGRLLNEDGDRNASLEDVAFWLDELLAVPLQNDELANQQVDLTVTPSSQTGLDFLVELILDDPGLNRKVATSEIVEAVRNADLMNNIIAEAIEQTGIASNGQINAADVRDLNDYIQSNYSEQWIVYHGDDEDSEVGQESGFHLVQHDGASTRLLGQNAIDTVADGIYHLGFEVDGDRLLNEDGNRNASLATVAFWLSELLEEELENQTLPAAQDPYLVGDSQTGLDAIVQIITQDPGLNNRIASSEISAGAGAANELNKLIKQAVWATGAANDGQIDEADIYDINAYLRRTAGDIAQWTMLHGDDEGGEETGFHYVQNDGATTHLFGYQNAVNTVADGIYHLGFEIERGRLLNEDGDRNASVKDVAYWLSEFLEEDLRGDRLRNESLLPNQELIVQSVVVTNGPVVMRDRVGAVEIPNEYVPALTDGTFALRFVADDVSGRRTLFSKDARDFGDGGHVSAFVRDGRLEVRLQSETESFTLFSEPGSIRAGQEYHFAMTFGAGGFRIFLDGDLVNSKPEFTGGIENNAESLVIGANTWARDAGNPNWRADFFAGQIREFTIYNRALNRAEAALLGGAGEQDPGAQAVGLEQLVRIILNDPGLNRSVDPEQIQLGAQYAFALNWLIEGAIEATGVANDREIQVADIYDINAYLRRNENSIALWTGLHGDDQGDAETGFHLVQNDGATTQLFGDSNAVNTVADGIYHLGFEIEGGRLLNEDGDRNASLEDVAFWLDELLAVPLQNDELANQQVDLTVTPSSQTGLDFLVELILDDPGLNRKVATSEIVEAARNADLMNNIIAEAIEQTGIASNGQINAADVRDLNDYIQSNYSEQWIVYHGDDEDSEVGQESGFHLVQHDGASTRLLGQNAIDTVADGIYHLGFEVDGDRLLNEDGNRNASLATVAFWLSELLEEELENQTLPAAQDPYLVGDSQTGLDAIVQIITQDPGLNNRIASSEISAGAGAANELNKLIKQAVWATGAANDGQIDEADIYDINAYLRRTAGDIAQWTMLHGDDEGGEETGFHYVQNDGATTHLFGYQNAVNTVADGIYHLGFEIERGRLLNEDGDRNASVKDVAYWLDRFLENDFDELFNESLAPTQERIQEAVVLTVDDVIQYRPDPPPTPVVDADQLASEQVSALAEASAVPAGAAIGFAADPWVATTDRVLTAW